MSKTQQATDWRNAVATLNMDGRAFIDGQRVAAAGGETFEVFSPVDGRLLTLAARGQAADIDRAVAVARAAFADGRWARLAPAKRRPFRPTTWKAWACRCIGCPIIDMLWNASSTRSPLVAAIGRCSPQVAPSMVQT